MFGLQNWGMWEVETRKKQEKKKGIWSDLEERENGVKRGRNCRHFINAKG